MKMVNDKRLEDIRQLTSLSEEGASLLAEHFERKVLKKGEVVLKEGEICTGFYFVEKGYLRTFYDKDGIEINIYFHFEGAFTTDMKRSKLGIPSEFTIEAGEKSVIWVLDRGAFGKLTQSSAEIMHYSRQLLVQVAIDMSAHSSLFKIYSPAERYQYVEKNNPHLLQRISLSDLSSYLGVNRRTLSRIRGKK